MPIRASTRCSLIARLAKRATFPTNGTPDFHGGNATALDAVGPDFAVEVGFRGVRSPNQSRITLRYVPDRQQDGRYTFWVDPGTRTYSLWWAKESLTIIYGRS